MKKLEMLMEKIAESSFYDKLEEIYTDADNINCSGYFAPDPKLKSNFVEQIAIHDVLALIRLFLILLFVAGSFLICETVYKHFNQSQYHQVPNTVNGPGRLFREGPIFLNFRKSSKRPLKKSDPLRPRKVQKEQANTA
jgi:hypothetical protein